MSQLKQRRHRSKAWIEYTNKGAKDDMVGYYNVITKGHMDGKAGNIGLASFGTFEKINDTWVLYTATLWSDDDGKIYHCYESEYADDLAYLRDNSLRYY